MPCLPLCCLRSRATSRIVPRERFFTSANGMRSRARGQQQGTRRTLRLGADDRAAIFELTGSVLVTGAQRPAVGFGARAIGFSDSHAGSDAEDSKIKDLIGFSKTKREYAYQLGVDAYTDNQKLQDRLNEIAWAGYAGGLTWAAAMSAVPGGAGLAITISGTHKLLNEVFRATPPADLRRANGDKLKAMNVHPEVADAFLNNSVYSPYYQTLLVNALDGNVRRLSQSDCSRRNVHRLGRIRRGADDQERSCFQRAA
jgi:hypothetical protein